METISLKGNSPEVIIPLLEKALDREKRILLETLRITRERIDRLAKKLAVDIDKLVAGEVEHTESEDMEFIELEGEIEIMRHLKAELYELESVEICR